MLFLSGIWLVPRSCVTRFLTFTSKKLTFYVINQSLTMTHQVIIHVMTLAEIQYFCSLQKLIFGAPEWTTMKLVTIFGSFERKSKGVIFHKLYFRWFFDSWADLRLSFWDLVWTGRFSRRICVRIYTQFCFGNFLVWILNLLVFWYMLFVEIFFSW